MTELGVPASSAWGRGGGCPSSAVHADGAAISMQCVPNALPFFQVTNAHPFGDHRQVPGSNKIHAPKSFAKHTRLSKGHPAQVGQLGITVLSSPVRHGHRQLMAGPVTAGLPPATGHLLPSRHWASQRNRSSLSGSVNARSVSSEARIPWGKHRLA